MSSHEWAQKAEETGRHWLHSLWEHVKNVVIGLIVLWALFKVLDIVVSSKFVQENFARLRDFVATEKPCNECEKGSAVILGPRGGDHFRVCTYCDVESLRRKMKSAA